MPLNTRDQDSVYDALDDRQRRTVDRAMVYARRKEFSLALAIYLSRTPEATCSAATYQAIQDACEEDPDAFRQGLLELFKLVHSGRTPSADDAGSTPEDRNPFLALLSKPPFCLEEPIGALSMRHILLAKLAEQDNKGLDAGQDQTATERLKDKRDTSEAIMMVRSKALVLTIGDSADLHG